MAPIATNASPSGRRLVAGLLTAAAVAAKSSAGSASLGSMYARMLQTNPVRTKLVQAIFLTSIGNILGQIANGAKALDLKSTLCYVLATMPPYSHFWYLWLDSITAPVVVKVAVDQIFWRSLMIFVDFVSYGFWAGHSRSQIVETVSTTFVETWKRGIVLWTSLSFFNQTYVPALYQTVTQDAVSFGWTMYMAVQVAKAGGGGDKDKAKKQRPE